MGILMAVALACTACGGIRWEIATRPRDVRVLPRIYARSCLTCGLAGPDLVQTYRQRSWNTTLTTHTDTTPAPSAQDARPTRAGGHSRTEEPMPLLARHANAWTPEQDAIVRAMRADQRSTNEIALRLGRSVTAVSQRISTLGLGRRVAS